MKPLKFLLLICCLQLVVAAPAQQVEEKSSHARIAALEQAAYKRSRQLSVSTNNFDVSYYRCEWTVDPAVRYIKGSITAAFTLTTAAGNLVFDLHKDLKADSVVHHGVSILFQQGADNSLAVQLPQTFAAGRKDSLTIYYQGVPPVDGFGSFVTTLQNGVPVMWTLSEPYGAKDWWPCKNAQADKADSIDVVLHYPAQYSSASNGVLVAETVAGDRKTSYWRHRYPISSYLVAIAVADYTTEKDSVRINNTTIPVYMHAYGGNSEYFRSATQTAKNCLQKFSSLFGLYPFAGEAFSQTQFGWGGGMEHQTNSFITSTYDQLVAHELGHQWFGDKVTCRSWSDIWLNEGFASYMQFIYVENFDPAQKLAYLQNTRGQITSRPDGSVRVNDTTNAGRIFDSRLTYLKGSFLLHMIRWKLGDTLFFKAIRQYLNDPLVSYGTATTADLRRNLESAGGQSFATFFANWYEGEGYPNYQVTWTPNKNNLVKIKIDQTTSHPSVSFYGMPVPLGLRGAGRDTVVVLDHTRSGQEFWVDPGFRVDTVIFDPANWLLSGTNSVTGRPAASAGLNDIRIYPNPVTDRVAISIANPAGHDLSLRLYNAAGQLLYKKNEVLGRADQVFSVSLPGLPAGAYWLHIAIDGKRAVIKKLIK